MGGRGTLSETDLKPGRMKGERWFRVDAKDEKLPQAFLFVTKEKLLYDFALGNFTGIEELLVAKG